MARGSSRIGLQDIGIAGVLRQFQLRVPPNQREYAWTETEVQTLYRDFAEAIHEDGPYFLGSIVTIPRDGDRLLEVVDGQQRLATVALLLAAIRDHLRGRSDIRVQYIEGTLLWGIDPDAEEIVPKLLLNLDDADYFKRLIGSEDQPEPTRSSHRRLKAARDLARTHVSQILAPLDERRHADELNEWTTFLERRAEVILLQVPDDASAYRMFETLNDRGLRTSQADLVKNYLYEQAGNRLSEVQSHWSYMHGALDSAYGNDSDALLTFLRHALIVQRGHIRQADVYRSVQEQVRTSGTAVTFSTELETLANTYVATSNPEHERWNTYPDAVRRAITAHNIMDIKPMRAALLAVGARMEPRLAAHAYSFLLSLAVRLNIASSTRSAAVEEPLANVARDVYAGTVDSLSKLRDALKSITPTDSDFRNEFAVARVSNARLARYYLRSIETAAKGEPDPAFLPWEDRQAINLEHVMPKKPDDAWDLSDEDVRQWSPRLGNLVLMRAVSNADLRSRPFSDKRGTYGRSPFLLTSQVADAHTWGPAEIQARQDSLADIAVRTWPITGQGGSRADREEDMNEATLGVVRGPTSS